jgi:hypothetical protein
METRDWSERCLLCEIFFLEGGAMEWVGGLGGDGWLAKTWGRGIGSDGREEAYGEGNDYLCILAAERRKRREGGMQKYAERYLYGT